MDIIWLNEFAVSVIIPYRSTGHYVCCHSSNV